MRLEEKMFIRTKTGCICKLININDFREPSMKYGVEASYLKDIMFIGDDGILKASHNIIDLIEVGDYVNGELVIRLFQPTFLSMGELSYVITTNNKYEEQDIKTIVTKEMFSSVEYRVETN